MVPKDDDLMGKLVEVDIISTGKHYLMGRLVEKKDAHRPENVPPPLKKGEISGISQVVNFLTDNINTSLISNTFYT